MVLKLTPPSAEKSPVKNPRCPEVRKTNEIQECREVLDKVARLDIIARFHEVKHFPPWGVSPENGSDSAN